MQPRTRLILQIFGGVTVAAAVGLFTLGRGGLRIDAILGIADPAASKRGEEVYASHDCSDCHLSTQLLGQKRQKKESGLIRVRNDFTVLMQFLETDKRHETFKMISENDRKDLVEYLRTLIIR